MIDGNRSTASYIGSTTPGQHQRSATVLQEYVADDDTFHPHIERSAVREIDAIALGGKLVIGALHFVIRIADRCRTVACGTAQYYGPI